MVLSMILSSLLSSLVSFLGTRVAVKKHFTQIDGYVNESIIQMQEAVSGAVDKLMER